MLRMIKEGTPDAKKGRILRLSKRTAPARQEANRSQSGASPSARAGAREHYVCGKDLKSFANPEGDGCCGA